MNRRDHHPLRRAGIAYDENDEPFPAYRVTAFGVQAGVACGLCGRVLREGENVTVTRQNRKPLPLCSRCRHVRWPGQAYD